MTPWFDEQTAGMIGGVLGAVLGGGFGGIGGGVGGPLAAMGKARGLVLGIFSLAIVIGSALALTALVALIMGQPWHVPFAIGFPGLLTAGIMGGLLPVVRKRYQQAEHRRLDADAIRRA